jgi:phosphomannomutase
MRSENAIYGGEMSAHHYFRDFAYCDSGMIPWLLVTELLSRSGKKLSQLVGERIKTFPCSGEINFRVSNVVHTVDRILQHYTQKSVRPDETTSHSTKLSNDDSQVAGYEPVEGMGYPIIDRTDGVSVEFPEWRFNLRGSNTEPLLRLNVETRANMPLLVQRVAEIAALIEAK